MVREREMRIGMRIREIICFNHSSLSKGILSSIVLGCLCQLWKTHAGTHILAEMPAKQQWQQQKRRLAKKTIGSLSTSGVSSETLVTICGVSILMK
jgi:hypothetical protein